MKLEPTDFPKLAFSLLALLVMAIIGAGAVRFALKADAQAVLERDNARKEFAEYDGKLKRVRNEEAEIREKSSVFAQLQKHGVIGEEQRLDWVELLTSIRDNRRLIDMRYEIAPQRLLDTTQSTADSALAFHASAMIVQLQLLHEEDLLRFLGDLRENASALIRIRRCELSRLPHGAADNTPRANLQAECLIDWITLRSRPERSEKSTKP